MKSEKALIVVIKMLVRSALDMRKTIVASGSKTTWAWGVHDGYLFAAKKMGWELHLVRLAKNCR